MKVDKYIKTHFFLGLFACGLPFQAKAEFWSFNENSAGATPAYEATKAINNKFEGGKLIITGQTTLSREKGEVSERLKCCARPSHPEYLYGLLDTKLHWGFNGTNLEYTSINFAPWATKWEPSDNVTKKLRTEWDLLELGSLRFLSDDTLGLKSYFEISLLRAGRMGSYRWSLDSPFTINMGMQASTGWAFAKSQNTAYSKVSNPFAGIFFKVSIDHKKWGKLYTNLRFVNGFSFSNPSRGHPTAREARVRLGYLSKLTTNITLNFYGEKRSFYFDEGGLPGLYIPSGIFGLTLTYHWY